MELTAGQALEILGKIIFINEQMHNLLFNYATSKMYDDDVSDIREFILDDKYPVTADVKIELHCEDGISIIQQTIKQARENSRLTYYLDAHKILAELEELNQKIKRQNR